LSGVSFIQENIKATADNLTIPISVLGLTTVDHNLPISQRLPPLLSVMPEPETRTRFEREEVPTFRPEPDAGFSSPSDNDRERERGLGVPVRRGSDNFPAK